MVQEADQLLDPRIEAVLPDLQAAYDHHQAGRLDEAAALYEGILLAVPDLGDALHLLGQIALTRGQPERAIELIGKAIDNLPDDFVEAHLNLGNAYVGLRQPQQAEACYRRAIAIDPELAEAHCNLARVLNVQGQHEPGLESCMSALRLAPMMVEALLNQAVALRGLRRFEEAEAPLRQALALRPERAETWKDLATLLCDLRRYDEAVPLHEKSIELRPNDPAMHASLAITLVWMSKASVAVQHARRAIELAPLWVDGWITLGWAEQALGRFEEARTSYRRALEIDPNRSEAQWNLNFIGRQASDSPERARLEAALMRPDTPTNDRIAAGYTLGKILDDADDFDAAFATFAAANALLRRQRAETGERFDAAEFVQGIDQLIGHHPRSFFREVIHWGNASELPVFVVGMPRSGTTLVEQIAASHSRVFGAGELADLRKIGSAMAVRNQRRVRMADWDPMHARQLADEHIKRLSALGGGAVRVIDKLPDNVFALALIAALFPGARVLIVERDPRDCCLSNFFQFFTHGNLFALDLHDCGVRARETARLIRHWQTALPLRLLRICYEDLVADLEGQTRRLIEFLGLDWEPACLEFYRTERTVYTPSQWQVRQPIYTRAVGRWRHYEKHLAPLFAALAAGSRA